MKNALLMLSLLAASLITAGTRAEVLEVTIWKTVPGATNAVNRTFARGLEAKAIQSKHGAEVSVARDMQSRMHFATAHKNWVSWNKFWASLEQDKANQKFWNEVNNEPAAAAIDEHYLINFIASGESGEVFEAYVWDPASGRDEDLYDAGLAAKKIHDKTGLTSASVGIDRLGRLHYVLNYASWEDYAKFHDTPNPDYEAFMAEALKDPVGKLFKVYTGSEQGN